MKTLTIGSALCFFKKLKSQNVQNPSKIERGAEALSKTAGPRYAETNFDGFRGSGVGSSSEAAASPAPKPVAYELHHCQREGDRPDRSLAEHRYPRAPIWSQRHNSRSTGQPA